MSSFKLKVLAGIHRVGAKYSYDNGKRFESTPGRNVARGETFDSPTDLSKIFPEKFARVDSVEAETAQAEESEEEFEGMTMEELKKTAAELEISFPPNTSRKALIAKLREASLA